MRKLAIAALICSAFCALAGACNTQIDTPPIPGNVYEGGTMGGHPGGGGGSGGGDTLCAMARGQCLLAGDMCEGGSCASCPKMLGGTDICGPHTFTEAGVLYYICCTDFNDAGAPDVVNN